VKLVSTIHEGMPRLGAVAGESVIDLARAFDAYREDHEPLLAAPPGDVLSLLQEGEPVIEAVKAIFEWAGAEKPRDAIMPLAEVRLDAPLRNPSKVICIGLNYADHCREQNIPEPESPVLFVKFPTAIIGPGEAIQWPEGVTEQVDYEAELAVVIGQEARNVPAGRAMEVIAGYTIINDVSARDVQFSDKQWVRGKSFDTFCPMGPYFVTADEINDPHDLGIKCLLNGDAMQDSSTAEMIFKLPYLIEFITRTATLLPGDVISTGTPDGVGVFRDPQVFLKPGDEVIVEIDGLGALRNPVG
jgi:2-keto-4-pentenoate hydratase/2-oxohepta-3-ene-1,7-dioic acid hydratase in catechol pathway